MRATASVFKVYGYTLIFFSHYCKGSNFMTSHLHPWMTKPIQKGVFSVMEEFSPGETNYFIKR